MFLFIPIIIALGTIVVFAGLGTWVYKDAKKRGINAWLWVFIVIVLNSYFIGFILYMLVARKESLIRCISCNAKILTNSKFCNFCGQRVTKIESTKKEEELTDKSIFKRIIIISLIGVISSTVVGLGLFMPKIISDISHREFYNTSQEELYGDGVANATVKGMSFIRKTNESTNFLQVYASSTNTQNTKPFEYREGKIFDINYFQTEGEAILYLEQDGNILFEENLTEHNNKGNQRHIIIDDVEGLKEGMVNIILDVDGKGIEFTMQIKDRGY